MYGKTRQVQVDMDPVNHCDPHLIDLFGASDHAPGVDVYRAQLFKSSFLTSTAENQEARKK